MENLYKVKSFNVVAFLKLKGFVQLYAQKENNDVVFYFQKSKELFDSINDYNANEELKQFISAFKEVRTIASSLK